MTETSCAADLCVRAGERVALRGPNGSGKTTVLRCVLGTLAPTSGSVTVGSHAAGTLAARALIGASLSAVLLATHLDEDLGHVGAVVDLGARP